MEGFKKPYINLDIVVPVYQNQGSIVRTYNSIIEVFQKITHKNVIKLHFIFVNDGSTDNSLLEIKQLQTKHDNISLISFSRNFGQIPALIAGFNYSTGDIVCNISADMQDPPELIAEMVEKWMAGYEIVIGTRLDREDDFISKVTSKFFYGLMNKLNSSIPPGGFDFFLMDRLAVDHFNQIDERNRFFQSDILWLGFKVFFVKYSRRKREIGKSQWTISKKLKYFIDGVLSSSYSAIRLISLFGFITSLCGFLYALVIIYLRFVSEVPFTGWAPIMILILIIGGAIMIMLGIIGEYIWRIYDEVRNRKVYLISEYIPSEVIKHEQRI